MSWHCDVCDKKMGVWEKHNPIGLRVDKVEIDLCAKCKYDFQKHINKWKKAKGLIK